MTRPSWVLVGLGTFMLLVLQVPPLPGVILSFLGGPLWVTLGIQATMLLLTLECLDGRLPRPVLAAPILFFAIGPALFLVSGFEAMRLNTELAAARTPPAIYDPRCHSVMLTEGYNVAVELIGAYEIDTVYLPAPRGARDPLRALRFSTECPHDPASILPLRFHSAPVYNSCALIQPERPTTPLVNVSFSQTRGGGLSDPVIYRASAQMPGVAPLQGAIGHYQLFAPWSLLIAGCWMEVKFSPYECHAHFPTFDMQLGAETREQGENRAALIAQMLGLRERAHRRARDGVVLER